MTLPCSDLSRARDEPALGTASRVERWLLVEHAGPWGPPALPLSRLDTALAQRLTAVDARPGTRVLLLRRPMGVPCPPGRQVFTVDSRPGRERVLTRRARDDAELLGLPLPLDEPAADGWTPAAAPLLLVCTHGRHDQCCAVRGRPLAAALSALRPEQVWECSHVGGDRFAANLVVLPLGLYLGRVPEGDAAAVLAVLEDGRVPVPLVRGRSSLPLPVQAAEQFARERTGRDRLDDLVLHAQETVGSNAWRVRLRGTVGPDVVVDVRWHRDGLPPAPLTCGAAEKVAPRFECLQVLDDVPART
jgi:hypothetical protein